MQKCTWMVPEKSFSLRQFIHTPYNIGEIVVWTIIQMFYGCQEKAP